MNTVLVTGAGGFIGSALCRHLESIKIPHIPCGRREFSQLKNILRRQKPHVIVHLAGGRAAGLAAMVEDNIITTIKLCETVQSISPYHPRIMVIGSAAEYGPQGPSLIKENAPTHPEGLYGQVKLWQTHTALHYARQGMDVSVARLFNIIGPGLPEGMAAGKFAAQIVHRKKIVTGDLSGWRDFLDIRDIVDALVVLSQKGKRGEVYNVCSGQKVCMRDLLKRMIDVSGLQVQFKEDKSKKPGVLHAIGSGAKFKKISRWKPQYTLDESIQDTLKSYQSL